MSNRRRRLAVLCGLALAMHLIGAAQATEPDSNVAQAQDTKCSCKACTPDACCKVPTGFQPLDDKCQSKCETKTWTVTPPAPCGTQAGCCQ
jgi:hypothetical protein